LQRFLLILLCNQRPVSTGYNQLLTNRSFLVAVQSSPVFFSVYRTEPSNTSRTDGEAPERGWSDLNGLAYSTREMGPASGKSDLSRRSPVTYIVKNIQFCLINRLRALSRSINH
jgi:hypothetical protein